MDFGEVSGVLVGAEEDRVLLIVGRLSNLQGGELAEECHMLQCRLDQWHTLHGQSDMGVFMSCFVPIQKGVRCKNMQQHRHTKELSSVDK